jgi:hypothetical protein
MSARLSRVEIFCPRRVETATASPKMLSAARAAGSASDWGSNPSWLGVLYKISKFRPGMCHVPEYSYSCTPLLVFL